MITADGELRHCDQEQNADLFWAARGAGPGQTCLPCDVENETIKLLADLDGLRFSRNYHSILPENSSLPSSIQETVVLLAYQRI